MLGQIGLIVVIFQNRLNFNCKIYLVSIDIPFGGRKKFIEDSIGRHVNAFAPFLLNNIDT